LGVLVGAPDEEGLAPGLTGNVLVYGVKRWDKAGFEVGDPFFLSDTFGEVSNTPGTVQQHLGYVVASTPGGFVGWFDPEVALDDGKWVRNLRAGELVYGRGFRSSSPVGVTAFVQKRAVESFSRFEIDDDGKIWWGDGTIPPDVNLFRHYSEALKTDGSLVVGGSFGVGTDPSYKLDVLGNFRSTLGTGSILLYSVAGGLGFQIRANAGIDSFIHFVESGVAERGSLGFESGSGDLIYSYGGVGLTNGVVLFKIQPDGQVVLCAGLTSEMVRGTRGLLSLYTSSSGIGLYSRFNNDVRIGRNAGTDVDIYISSAATKEGFVGINNLDPAFQLDVDGDMNLSAGSLYRIGGVQIGSSHLSDYATIAHINEDETISGSWTFNSLMKFALEAYWYNMIESWYSTETYPRFRVNASGNMWWGDGTKLDVDLFRGGDLLLETSSDFKCKGITAKGDVMVGKQLKVDEVVELTAAAGVTVESVKVKDGLVDGVDVSGHNHSGGSLGTEISHSILLNLDANDHPQYVRGAGIPGLTLVAAGIIAGSSVLSTYNNLSIKSQVGGSYTMSFNGYVPTNRLKYIVEVTPIVGVGGYKLPTQMGVNLDYDTNQDVGIDVIMFKTTTGEILESAFSMKVFQIP